MLGSRCTCLPVTTYRGGGWGWGYSCVCAHAFFQGDYSNELKSTFLKKILKLTFSLNCSFSTDEIHSLISTGLFFFFWTLQGFSFYSFLDCYSLKRLILLQLFQKVAFQIATFSHFGFSWAWQRTNLLNLPRLMHRQKKVYFHAFFVRQTICGFLEEFLK